MERPESVRAIPLWVKLLGGIAVLAAACVGLWLVPTGDVAYAPTDPIDLDGKVTVRGRPAEPPQGHLYLVGVTERKVNLLQRVLLDLTDPDVDFAAAPAGSGVGGPRRSDVESMAQAKEVAAGIALELAGERVEWNGHGASVDRVEPGTPAAQALRPGDIIVQVNGAAVDSHADVAHAIQPLAPNSRVSLGIQRAGQPVRRTIRTIPPAAGVTTYRSRIGVTLSTIGLEVVLPYEVGIDSGEVVGPSAGLAFALYLYDSLSPRDLLRGRHVVASGALSPDGQVFPVGRMRQKAIAAQEAQRDVLLVPFTNAAEARAAVRETCSEGTTCVRVVPVRSAREAVDLLLLDDAALDARLSTLEQAAG